MIIKQKKGFLLRDFIIVGIIFGMTISLFIIMVLNVSQNYNNTDIVNSNFANHYSTLENNLNKLNTANSAVQGANGLNLIGTFNIAFNSIFTVITMVWDSVLIYTGMASNIPGDFTFLDKQSMTILLTGAIAILTTYLVFVWLSSVSRGKI